MKTRPKPPAIPHERRETIRQEISAVLKNSSLTAREISGLVRISEKEVYDHLEHIQKTMLKSSSPLLVIPAECKKCGFQFRKRERLKKPGKCPVCRGESIEEPLFSLAGHE